MGWKAYDPKSPPKVGQKARCAKFGEINLVDGVNGFKMTRAVPISAMMQKDWEIFWEPNERPPIGSTFKIVGSSTVMEDSIGKIISHVDSNEADVEWLHKANDKFHPTRWGFPNPNVKVLEVPDQAKVGDLFRETQSGAVVRITAAENGKCDAELLFVGNSSYSFKEVRKNFGSATIDYSWSHWKRVAPPKVGEVYRTHDTHRGHQSAIEITAIVDNRVSAKILETNYIWKTGENHSNFVHLEYGCLPAHWLPVETPAKVKAEVGQVISWKNEFYLISKIDGEIAHGKRLDENGKEIESSSLQSFLDENGCYATVSEIQVITGYRPKKCVVGQVYRNKSTGQVAKITSIKVDLTQTNSSAEVLETGNGGSPGVKGEIRDPFGTLDSTGGTSFWGSWEFVPNYCSPPNQLAVGQVWRRSCGWTFKITKVEYDGLIYATILEVGDTGFTVGGEAAFSENAFWQSYVGVQKCQVVENYQPKIQVGQIFRRPIDGWVFKITEVKGGDVRIQTLEIGLTGFKVGETAAFDNETFTSRRILRDKCQVVDNYVQAIKIKVGQIWTYFNGLQIQIHRIDNGHIGIRVIKQGRSGFSENELVPHYATLDRDGYPTKGVFKGSDWSLTRESMPMPVKVGEAYISGGWKVKITKVDGNIISGKTIEQGASAYRTGTVHGRLTISHEGKMPAGWELVEMVPEQSSEEKPMNKVKVGQVWTHPKGFSVQVIKVGDGWTSVKVLAKGASIYREGQIINQFAVLEGRDETTTYFDNWTLTKQAPLTLEARELPKVGQVYRRGDSIVKITKTTSFGSVGIEVLQQGLLPQDTTALSTYGNGKVNIDWDLIQEPLENKSNVHVGQHWKMKDGWTVKITEVYAHGVKSECVARGDTTQTVGAKYTWGEWLRDNNAPPFGWEKTDSVMESPVMKVGQVWSEEAPRNCKVRIVAIENGYAQVVFTQSGISGYPEGHKHNTWFLVKSKYDSWKLEMDVPEYGDRVEVQIGESKIQGTYLGDVDGRHNVVHLDQRYDDARWSSWAASGDGRKLIEDLKLKSGSFCWSVIEGQSKITKVVKKEKQMSNEKKDTQDKESFGQMLKSDFRDAAIRTAGTQMTVAVQTAILAMLKDRGADDGRLAAAKDLLGSDFGAVMIRALLGFGLPHVPMLGEDPRALMIAKEFRVSAMDKSMEEIMGATMTYLMPALNSAMSALPPLSSAVPEVFKGKTKSRIAPAADDAVDEEEEETQEEAKAANAD